MEKPAQFLKDTLFPQCEYPPRLVYGKSVWAELLIDSDDKLCFAGHDNYIPTIKMSEITDYAIEDDYDIYIMAKFESQPIVIAFCCADTGILSLNFWRYGSFSISFSGSCDISDYRDGGKLHKTFIHIDPDKEEDYVTVCKILASWRNQPTTSLLSKIGKVPHISDQVLKIFYEWEGEGRISKKKCFQKISKLMADNGIKSLEDAVDVDIAECYIEWFNEYKVEVTGITDADSVPDGKENELPLGSEVLRNVINPFENSNEDVTQIKSMLDRGELSVDDLSLEELEDVNEKYRSDISDLDREIDALEKENRRLKIILGKQDAE